MASNTNLLGLAEFADQMGETELSDELKKAAQNYSFGLPDQAIRRLVGVVDKSLTELESVRSLRS